MKNNILQKLKNKLFKTSSDVVAGGLIVCFFVGLFSGIGISLCRPKKIVYVDFLKEEVVIPTVKQKYNFLPAEVSDYIVRMCEELEIDSDLAVAILMQENPEVNFDAVNKNKNGTMDLGLWQLNDKYLYTTFSEDFWDFDVELNAFDWKHNTFIALHQIEWLQSRLKVFDDIVMAYNCGIGNVMNRTVPPITRTYLSRVKNNYNLLKGDKENEI